MKMFGYELVKEEKVKKVKVDPSAVTVVTEDGKEVTGKVKEIPEEKSKFGLVAKVVAGAAVVGTVAGTIVSAVLKKDNPKDSCDPANPTSTNNAGAAVETGTESFEDSAE